MVCLNTKYHRPCSSCSLVSTIEPTVNYGFHTASKFSYYVLQEFYLNKCSITIRRFEDPVLSGASIIFLSDIRLSSYVIYPPTHLT